MITRFHYDRETLARFLDEPPPENDSDIAVHLEQCNECQSTLESMLREGLTMEAAGELLRDGAVEQLTYVQPLSEPLTELDRSTFLEPSMHPGSLGRFARFEIMEFLGQGGMGIVMRGYDTSLNRYSAVKVLAPALATSAAARKRFSREAKSAAAVVHPHVVPIQTVDEHNGLPYLVMPVVEGQSVDARVRNSGPLSVIEAVRVASQVAEGLAAAHAQGLVHRDIKPANVLLEYGVERVQITDFGLARAIDDASMTRSGVIAGTPQYMSPEQAHGDSIDHRSDLFSLGSLIYFMLTGHSPFRAETTMGVLNRIGNEQPRSLRSINADIPERFEQIVMKLLAKPREERFQTASEVAELLQSWHAHFQQPDVFPPPPKPVQKLASDAEAGRSRGELAKWLIATALFGLLALAGVLIVLELGKGTLTIKSDADDVPVRIMQGDEVVKQLTVTKMGTSVRVASGEYVVVIDGEFSDIHIESGTVSLGRGETRAVHIVRSKEHALATANANEELSLEALTGVLTAEQVLAHGQQLSKHKNAPVSVSFQVGSVAQQVRLANSGPLWCLCSSNEPSELGVGILKIWISPAAEAALKEQGITDIQTYYLGKMVTIAGQVFAGDVTDYGQPSSLSYSMELETLDQLSVLAFPVQLFDPDDQWLQFGFYGPEGICVILGPIDRDGPDRFIGTGPFPDAFYLVTSMRYSVYVSNLPKSFKKDRFDDVRFVNVARVLVPPIDFWTGKAEKLERNFLKLTKAAYGYDPVKESSKLAMGDATRTSDLRAELVGLEVEEIDLHARLKSLQVPNQPTSVAISNYVTADQEVDNARKKLAEIQRQISSMDAKDLHGLLSSRYESLTAEAKACKEELVTLEAAARERAIESLSSQQATEAMNTRAGEIKEINRTLMNLNKKRTTLRTEYVKEWSRLEQKDGETVELSFAREDWVQANEMLSRLKERLETLRVQHDRDRVADPTVFELEVRRVDNELYRRLQIKQIRFDFSNEDFAQVASGNAHTKVIYLPTEALHSAGSMTLKTLSSLDVDHGIDVVAEAERRGKVLAILQTPLR